MKKIFLIFLVLFSFASFGQVYQAMPQPGYGPVKRMLFDSVLTLPTSITSLRNITGGRDTGQIRYNKADSAIYVHTGYGWIKDNSGGTITSIATGLGLSGGTITSSGTLIVDTSSASILSRQRAAYTYAPISITGTVTSVTGTSPVVSSGGATPAISMPVATTSVNGYLSSANWTTFNAKESALTFSSPLSRSTNTISIPAATTSVNGYLSSTDWTTFNNKQATISATSPVVLTGAAISIPAATTSVNGYLTSANWTTFNNKQATITLTTTGTSGASTLVGATLNIPNYADAYVGTVTSVAALTLGTTGTDLSSTVATGTTTPVITLQVPTASATNRGALSSADWTTFNNKAPALSGTTNYVPKFTGASTIGNSVIQEASSSIGIGVSPVLKLDVQGNAADITTVGGVTVEQVSLFRPSNGIGGIRNGFNTTSGDAYIWSAQSSGNLYLGTRVAPNTNVNISIFSSGNTGLGTGATDAGYKLNVNGTGNFSGALDVSLPPSVNGQVIKISRSAGAYSWGIGVDGSASNFNFYNNSVTSVANISPTGAATFSSTISAGGYIYGTATANAYIMYNNSSHYNWLVGSQYNISNAFEITPSTAVNGTTFSTPALQIASSGAATFSSSVTATSLIKSGGTSAQYLMADGSTSTLTNPVTGTGTTNYLPKFTSASAIGNSQIFDDGTNVGVGTTSPSALLDVASTSAFTYASTPSAGVKIGVQGTGSSFMVQTPSLSGGYSSGLSINGTYSGGKSEININAFGVYSGGPYSADLVFKTSTNTTLSEKMRITNTGNVLIGTTTDAGYKLDVSGTGNFSGALSGTSASFSGDVQSSYRLVVVGQTTPANYISSALVAGYNASGTQGWIQADGSLALGTNGTTRLTIASTGAATFSSSVTLGNFTTTEINALTPAAGMVVFNTTLSVVCFYDGTAWKKVSHSAM